ncbi:AI-2E family transporter [Methanosarcina sp. KYL-1]|uniref:AI-2E family transporter n=1 Tax=Methanosarcina sp. KYL-1 TaxID=2602068 RepID=UPI00210163E1|nr:AI-2E family transporter [Methanosarcina sp. KYL-1]MCQ1536155.1 AI-2E family transporter [Methanosarcina sp. KYL-1]
MVLSANRNVWRFLLAISVFFAGFFGILFYFQDIFIILILGAVLLLISEKLLSYFNRVMDRFPNLNRKVVGAALIAFAFLSFFYLVSSQMHWIVALVAEAATVQQDYLSGSSALFGSDSEFARLTDSGVIRPEDLQAVGNAIFTELTGTISKVSYYLFSGVLIIPLMFSLYFRRRNNLDSYIYGHAHPKHAEVVLRALKSIGKELEDFFSAKMLESAVVGLICCIGFYLAGVDGWFFLGVLAGFLNIIPYIGPIIGAIPPIIVGYFNSPETAILAAATVLVAQLVDNFYLIPFMISEKVNINPLLSVVLTLAASKLLGPLGMIFAIPIFIIYKIIIIESYKALVKIYPDED